MQAIVNSLLTNYTKEGTGKVVLMLHGWGDSHTTFASLQKQLARLYETVSVSLPGFGGSQSPQETWGLEEYAKFVAEFQAKIGLKDIYAVVGHSNGGAIAIYGVSTEILKPQKIVLIGAAGIRNTQSTKKTLLKGATKIGKLATVWLPAAQRHKLRNKLYTSVGSDMLIAPELEATFKKTVGQDVQTNAADIAIPTLLIYGQNDEATPPVFGERFHQLIPTSELEIIQGAGHFVHHDDLEATSKYIKEFLNA